MDFNNDVKLHLYLKIIINILEQEFQVQPRTAIRIWNQKTIIIQKPIGKVNLLTGI